MRANQLRDKEGGSIYRLSLARRLGGGVESASGTRMLAAIACCGSMIPAQNKEALMKEGENMYAIDVAVILQARDGMMGLSRRLSLPFPPFEGMGLYGLTTEPKRAETVAFVAWDVINKLFYVELFDCQSPEESLSELIDYYGLEWELHEPGFDPVEEA